MLEIMSVLENRLDTVESGISHVEQTWETPKGQTKSFKRVRKAKRKMTDTVREQRPNKKIMGIFL